MNTRAKAGASIAHMEKEAIVCEIMRNVRIVSTNKYEKFAAKCLRCMCSIYSTYSTDLQLINNNQSFSIEMLLCMHRCSVAWLEHTQRFNSVCDGVNHSFVLDSCYVDANC